MPQILPDGRKLVAKGFIHMMLVSCGKLIPFCSMSLQFAGHASGQWLWLSWAADSSPRPGSPTEHLLYVAVMPVGQQSGADVQPS